MGIGFRVSGPGNVTRPVLSDLLLSFRFSYERILPIIEPKLLVLYKYVFILYCV